MRLQVKLLAVLLMVLAGLAQAQERKVFQATFGVQLQEKKVPSLIVRAGREMGFAWSIYADFNKPNDKFSGVEYWRLGWAAGPSYSPFQFLSLYAGVDNYRKDGYLAGERFKPADSDDWGAQVGAILHVSNISASASWSTASKHALIGLGFSF